MSIWAKSVCVGSVEAGPRLWGRGAGGLGGDRVEGVEGRRGVVLRWRRFGGVWIRWWAEARAAERSARRRSVDGARILWMDGVWDGWRVGWMACEMDVKG